MSATQVPVGCAFLTRPTSLSSGGWASLAGAEPFRFTTLETLGARGALWVLQTQPAAFQTESGGEYPFLRHSDFLATPVQFIAQELGAGNSEDGATSAKLVAEVLTRVVEMSGALDEGILTRLSDGQSSLVSAIQASVAPPLRLQETPEDLAGAMRSLFKPPAPLSPAGVRDLTVRIPANRLRLAQIVMLSAVPAGLWSEVKLTDFPTPAMALSWAIGNQQPVICSVTVRGPVQRAKEATAVLRGLASGATRWMALPEIVAMSRLTELSPKRIFVANEFVSPQATLRVPPPVFAPAAAGSISAGLLAETYLQAVCSPSAVQQVDFEANAAAGQVHSVRAAWLTSAARSYMMQEAVALAEANISVIGFGNTHVMVSVPKRNLHILRKAIAASSLLSYPTALRALEEQGTLVNIAAEERAVHWEA